MVYGYNASMLVSDISKYIPEKITNVKLDSNNNVIPPEGAKRIDFSTAKSPYQK